MANSVFLYWIGSLPVSVSGSTLTITGNVATNALLLDAANQDIHIYRSGAKALKIDADGSGGVLNSITAYSGAFQLNGVDNLSRLAWLNSSGTNVWWQQLANSGTDLTWNDRTGAGVVQMTLFHSTGNLLLSTGNLGFGAADASHAMWKPSGTSIKARLGDDSADAALTAGAITASGAITGVGGITTTGSYGVPLIVASGRFAAQIAAKASLVTYTPAADASFEISANVLVTTATTHSFTFTCTYTDEGNTARTATLPFLLVAGSTITNTIANAAGAVPYQGLPMRIRAKASTAITCQTTGTFTTVVYNAEAVITQVQ